MHTTEAAVNHCYFANLVTHARNLLSSLGAPPPPTPRRYALAKWSERNYYFASPYTAAQLGRILPELRHVQYT